MASETVGPKYTNSGAENKVFLSTCYWHKNHKPNVFFVSQKNKTNCLSKQTNKKNQKNDSLNKATQNNLRGGES